MRTYLVPVDPEPHNHLYPRLVFSDDRRGQQAETGSFIKLFTVTRVFSRHKGEFNPLTSLRERNMYLQYVGDLQYMRHDDVSELSLIPVQPHIYIYQYTYINNKPTKLTDSLAPPLRRLLEIPPSQYNSRLQRCK